MKTTIKELKSTTAQTRVVITCNIKRFKDGAFYSNVQDSWSYQIRNRYGLTIEAGFKSKNKMLIALKKELNNVA